MNYIFLADGYETVEALAVVDMMKRAKLPLIMVSMNPTTAVRTSQDIRMEADITFKDFDPSDADMLILPGGMPGTINLEENAKLCELLKKHCSEGKNIAAICAAPRILGGLGLLKGRRACCYPGVEERLTGARCTTDPVTVDGNIITSRGMGTAVLFGAAIIEKLSGKELADGILSQIVYPG